MRILFGILGTLITGFGGLVLGTAIWLALIGKPPQDGLFGIGLFTGLGIVLLYLAFRKRRVRQDW